MDKEKADLGAQTLGAFFDQFGKPSDPKTTIFLEILLKELLNVKVISLLSKQKQEGD